MTTVSKMNYCNLNFADPLGMPPSVSAFAVGHFAVSSKLSRSHVSFLPGELQDNIVIANYQECFNGSKTPCTEIPLDAFTWLVHHFSHDGDTVVAISSINALIASLISGRNCIKVGDDSTSDHKGEVISKALQAFASKDDTTSIHAESGDEHA